MSTGDDFCRVVFYDSNFDKCIHINRELLISNSSTYGATYQETENGFNLQLSTTAAHDDTAYLRFVFSIHTLGTFPMISVNEEIKYSMQGTLRDGIKVKPENVLGLDAAPSVHTHTAEQVDFVLPAHGEYVEKAQFTDTKSPYQENVWYNSSGTKTATTSGSHIWIEPKKLSQGDVIRIRGVNFASTWPGYPRIYIFNPDGSYKGQNNVGSLISSAATGSLESYGSYVWEASTSTLTVKFNGSSANSYCGAYEFGFGGQLATGYTAETVIMTINEEISYKEVWEGEPKRFDESLYAQNVMLTSPSGKVFKLSVNDSGTLSAVEYN